MWIDCKLKYLDDFFYIERNSIKKWTVSGMYDNGKDITIISMVEIDDVWNTSAKANSISDCFDTFEDASNEMREQCEQMISESKKELQK